MRVIVGTPLGRWHAEFTSSARAAQLATRLLGVANGVNDLSHIVVDTPVTLGMALTLSWRFVHGTLAHEQTCAMVHEAQAAYPRRQGINILEHPVLHCMPLPLDVDTPALPEHWSQMTPNLLGRALLEQLARVTNCASDAC